ncbi:DUF3331 domain-containing protein [Paraburkholderia sp. 1N]|uniref:DUF3331 domain-containing protein n=1 Tax=Paraburkholderia solitsugae TaxID=2675748 RepID=A0ABX2C233_9BURK|nr:DUF3331 domain-containing protein [Paraburkholderia solitsugae]NPT46411.1 DUF3331 domain-containing protein [Paraburkholderia solitsugae]
MSKPVGIQSCAAGHRTVLFERPKADLLVVSWSGARRGHYSEHVRRLGIASTAGPCAFSATAIRKGDSVFKPNTRPPPFNAGDMIPQSEAPEHISIDRGPPMSNQTSIT